MNETFEYSAFPIPVTVVDSAFPILPAMQTVKKLKHFHLHEYEEIILIHYFFQIPIKQPGPDDIQLFLCSTQLKTKFIMPINVKMPTIVGILTVINMINTTSKKLKARNFSFVGILVFMSS